VKKLSAQLVRPLTTPREHPRVANEKSVERQNEEYTEHWLGFYSRVHSVLEAFSTAVLAIVVHSDHLDPYAQFPEARKGKTSQFRTIKSDLSCPNYKGTSSKFIQVRPTCSCR